MHTVGSRTARVRDAQPFGCLCYSDISCSVRSDHLIYFIGLQDLLICSSVQMHAGWMWTPWGLYESFRPEAKKNCQKHISTSQFFFICIFIYNSIKIQNRSFKACSSIAIGTDVNSFLACIIICNSCYISVFGFTVLCIWWQTYFKQGHKNWPANEWLRQRLSGTFHK